MYEGKNIHYSSFDKKPLCSFSTKVCNQHRLNGYAFCVRHILEDPTAPFRRCSYVAKSSKQTCTQAIPKHEDREYCNNHMQVLGMLPRKEKKLKKDKNTEIISGDVKIPFQDRVKSRFNINKLQNDVALHSNPIDDPDDPYAFPDPSGDTKVVTTVVQPTTPSSAGDSPSSTHHVFAKSPGDSCSSGSSIAKFYPELAEKLEKIKPKSDVMKLMKEKGKDKSSRTMNSLQTRIAQNRIKSKRRSTQESTSQSQSPLHHHQGSPNDLFSGVGNHIDFDRPQKTPPAYNHFDNSPTEPHKSANVPGIELKRPPPSYFRQPFERLPVATSVNSPVVTLEGNQANKATSSLTVNHTVPMEIPHGTPLQSLPGISGRIPVPNAFNLDLPSASVLPNIAAYLSAVQAKNPYLTPLPPHLLSQMNIQHVPFINLNSPAVIQNQKEVEKITPSIPLTDNRLPPPPLPPPPPLQSPSGITNLFPSVCGGSTVTTSVTFTASSQQNRPPPPPYSSAVAQALNKPTVASIATIKPTFTKPLLTVVPSVPSVSLMSAKPTKLKNILSENDIDKRIRGEKAKKYYNAYLKGKIYNHSLLKTGVDSCSDDSSDDDSLLPWQPKWFSASSDEEGMDEEEDQNDVIRTTKLALLRARLRRHCSQSRKAFKGNVEELVSSTSVIQSLIDAARESSKPTVCAIKERFHVQHSQFFRYKRRGLDRRRCLYRNDEEVQCVNPVVPCANHCLKHIMYNIDQQLFDYCTAKTSDNIQCCTPVIDISHELPLCLKHAREVEESYKVEEEEIKPKRPRKKTKPSALTRPPKKGKKKKNQRKSAVLQTQEATVISESVEPVYDVEMDQSGSGSEDSDEGDIAPQVKSEHSKALSVAKDQISKPSSPLLIPPVHVVPIKTMLQQPLLEQHKEMEKNLLVDLPDSVLAANLPADLNKGLELPLEQASRLLEEQDFQDVLNKIPDETFDMFSGKNGEPTNEEMDELERHLAAANMDLSFAQQAINSTTDYDEQLRILASILTNPSAVLHGNDLMNGSVDEQSHESNSFSSYQTVPTGSQTGNQSVPINFQHNPMPQYHPSHQSNQVSPLHHSTVMNNMAGQGQVHQHNGNQGQAQQQSGSQGQSHQQTGSQGQMSPGNNSQLNQMRNSHHGSPIGQIQHHGSPVGQISFHGSPVNHIQGQIHNLQSPSMSHTGSPVPMSTQAPSTVQNVLNSVQNIQNINQQPNQVHNVHLVNTGGSQLLGHGQLLVGTQNVLRTSGHQIYSAPSSTQSVRVNNLPSSAHNTSNHQVTGHHSSNQQLNSVHLTSQVQNSVLPLSVQPTKLNQNHVQSPHMRVLYSSDIPHSTSSSGLVTNSVQSSYQSYQKQQTTGDNSGNIKNIVAQHTKVSKNQTVAVTTAGTSTRLAWQSNVDGVTVFQNGFPSHSAQFVNDVNSGKFVMSHGIQNCSDAELLQSITQSLTPDYDVINPQRIQLSAPTGTGS